MSDSKSPRSSPTRGSLGGPTPRPASTGSTGRFERPGVPRANARPMSSRHSAITRTLHNYASYKSWAEKVRSSWDPGKAPKG